MHESHSFSPLHGGLPYSCFILSLGPFQPLEWLSRWAFVDTTAACCRMTYRTILFQRCFSFLCLLRLFFVVDVFIIGWLLLLTLVAWWFLLYLFWHLLASLNLSRKVGYIKKKAFNRAWCACKCKNKLYTVAYLFNEKLRFILRVTNFLFLFTGMACLFIYFIPHFLTNGEAKWTMTFFLSPLYSRSSHVR